MIYIKAFLILSETQLSRQITPRTKNGHAPPITQS